MLALGVSAASARSRAAAPPGDAGTRTFTLPAYVAPAEKSNPPPPAVAALACPDGDRACGAEAAAIVTAVTTPNRNALAVAVDHCDRQAATWLNWRVCLESARKGTAALPAARYRLPDDGWMVFDGQEGGGSLSWVAIDLATGAYWAMATRDHLDGSTSHELETGQLPTVKAREMTLLTLLGPHVRGQLPMLEAKIPPGITETVGDVPDRFVQIARPRDEFPPGWRWLSPAGASWASGRTGDLGFLLIDYRRELLARQDELRRSRTQARSCPRAAPPEPAFSDGARGTEARAAIATAKKHGCGARQASRR